MSREGLPFSIEDEISMTSSIIADEAIEALDRTGSFDEAGNDPIFKKHLSGLVTQEMLETESEGSLQAGVDKMTRLMEQRFQHLMNEGFTESEAWKRVRGELLRGFVEVQLEKRRKEENNG